MKKEKLLEALKKAREDKKKFVQTFDLAINLTQLNLKKGEGKFSEDIVLPHGKGKPVKVAIFADGELADKLKKQDIITYSKKDIEEMKKEKRKARKIAREYDFLLAQTDFMVLIGKTLGAVLGPKGKMPKPLPPQADPRSIIARLEKSVSVRVKDDPVLHVPVGTEKMTDEQVAENIAAVLKTVENKLPHGKENLGTIYLKTTMGRSVQL